MTTKLLQDLTTPELLRKKTGLENGAAMAVAEGAELPDDVVQELNEMRAELARRGEGNAVTELPEHWLGRKISGYTLTAVLGEWRFAYIYLGNAPGAVPKLLLVAKPKVSAQREASAQGKHFTSKYQTEAFDLSLPPLSKADVSNDFVLRLQALTMRESMPDLVEEISLQDGRCYVRMPKLDGVSLRSQMQTAGFAANPASLRVFADICKALEQFHQIMDRHHGNLKPETVILLKDEVKLLAPGFLGPIELPGGNLVPLAITTVEYYPFVEQDDLLAVGIMLWESICGRHPLESMGDERAERRLSPKFRDFINQKILQGFKQLQPLLRLQTPSELRPGISPSLEALLLRALRLSLAPDGSLTMSPGFSSLADLRTALESL
jgi:serine/threonine protein kinase